MSHLAAEGEWDEVVPLDIQHLSKWLLFESVAVGVGGAAFYRKAFIDLDPVALQPAVLTTIFERMRALSAYTDKGFMKKRWDQATDQVSSGQALMQVQGTWVNGEFTAKRLEPGRDYHCWRFPDTQGVYLFNSDQFVFFKLPTSQQAAQRAFAATVMLPALQSAVNVRTGAAPARVDVSWDAFNSCGKRNITDSAAPTCGAQ